MMGLARCYKTTVVFTVICVRVSFFAFCVFSLRCLVVGTSAVNFLERPPELTCCVLSGMINPNHSFTHCPYLVLFKPRLSLASLVSSEIEIPRLVLVLQVKP